MTPEEIEEAVSIILKLLFRWEGLVLTPYLCSAGVPTIGLGSTRYLDGTAVTLNDPPITREFAVVMAKDFVRRKYLRAVRAYCPNLTQPARVAATSSLTYNIGTNALKNSTLRRRINDEIFEDVPNQFLRWTRAGGREVRGLVLRRRAEIKVWESA